MPTELTRGPWDPDAQHGGPPAALLATVVEQRHPAPQLQAARVTVEFHRPVPIAPLAVDTRELRAGRSVALHEATLSAGGREVMRATVLRMRTAPLPLASNRAAPPPPPLAASPQPVFPHSPRVSYAGAIEWSFLEGTFLEPGPARVWMRARYPLIAGEETLPAARVLLVADAASGVSCELDWRRWLFVNADLTVSLHRLPAGEWVCLDAATTLEPHGIGLCQARISDLNGAVGCSAQSLFLAERDR